MKRKYSRLTLEALIISPANVIAASGEAKNSMLLTEVEVEAYTDNGSFDVSFGEKTL